MRRRGSRRAWGRRRRRGWRWLDRRGLPTIIGSSLLRSRDALRSGLAWRWRYRRPAAAAIRARRHPLDLLAQRPFCLFGGDLDALDQRSVLGLAPVRLHVAVAIGVENPKLHRVDADQMRELVHLAFERKVHRRNAKTAHRGCRRAVGEYAIDVAIDVRDRIGAGQMRRAFDDGVAGQPRIGATVEIGADLARDDA